MGHSVAERDLTIDMIRGLVMMSAVTAHISLFSLYGFFFWERIGIVSGAEGFVILSGVVIGMAYKRYLAEHGWGATTWKFFQRAVLLWRANVIVILSIALLNYLHVNVREIMTYVDYDEGKIWPLFPEAGTPWQTWISHALLLRFGPHQIQILGLYVCLLLLCPLSFYLMSKGQTPLLLFASWTAYVYNLKHPQMLTGCMFEEVFPLMAWQLIFFHGQALGYHKEAVLNFFKGKGKFILIPVTAAFAALFFWAQNSPDQLFPSFARLSFIPPALFTKVYDAYMLRSPLGTLRLVDDACVLVVSYIVLSRFGQATQKAFGWFLIPIGQASLYVFIVHVYFVALASNMVKFGFPMGNPHFWLNTLVHTSALMCIWAMVRYKVLFRWVPR